MNFLQQFFTDVDGQASSKRLMTFIAFGMFMLICAMNLFKGKSVSPDILDFLFYMVLVGLGLISTEKFTGRGGSKPAS